MKSKGLNAFQLKLFMAFLMVFDHISQIPGLVPDGWDGVLHALTRCVGAAFAFMAVEGFLHTRNRLAYNMRLFFWAALMQTGNCILTLLFQEKGIYLTHNIFLTLACGVLMLSLFFGFSDNGGAAKDRKSGLRIAAGVLVLLAGLVFSEGGMALLPFMLLTYLFRNQVFFRNLSYVVWAGVLFAMSIQIYPTLQDTLSMLLYNSDWLFISALPLLHFYNGERGSSSKWSKYFFYIFYPAHLWLIALIAFWVK